MQKTFLIKPLLKVYTLRIPIYLYTIYPNIAWTRTHMTKFKKIHCQQKHAVRKTFNEDYLSNSRPLMQSVNTLNTYQVNLYQQLNFKHKLKSS